MRAVTQHRYGDADVLNVEEIDRPSIADEEVLIEVAAAGLDRGVLHLMTGTPYLIRLMGFGVRKPKNPVLGMDVSGRVVEVGSAVTDFQVGDEVMGIAKGSFAQFASASAAKLVHKPEGVSFDSAAASTISGITALQALTTQGNIAEGDRVLVIGASGGVGTFAVQIANSLGATVTGVASEAKREFVQSLGASDVIDYKTTDLGELDREFDLIIDIGGRNPIRKLRTILAPSGRLVIVGGEGGGKITGGIGRQLGAAMLSLFVKQRLGFFVSSESREYIQPLADLVASGAVAPAISDHVTLDQAIEGIRALEGGQVSGKIVIDVRSSR
ncbi:MAG: NAD(P)-dependent alcohol dehydrogenase [Acidimicrobiales bacterium]|nr:MAG: NAD(P)-dependent alcohol dehydrogenase [Acidimicrobiales bacterium]